MVQLMHSVYWSRSIGLRSTICKRIMLMKSPLVEANSELVLKDGIFQNGSELFRDSVLSNYIQVAVEHVFSQVSNKGLFSLDVEAALDTRELKTALSTTQFRFLSSLRLSGVNHVLDLSEDFGGVAHYLADQVGSVDAVKIDSDRTRLAKLRCANKPNVCHVSEDPVKLTYPDNHYDLIILGQFESLELDQEAFETLLSKLNAALSEKGVLLINAKNANSIGKLLNKGSGGIPYSDCYAVDSDESALTEFGRRDLRNQLLNARFSSVDFHVSFSPDKDIKHLFSEDYLTSNVDALNHFYRLGSTDNSILNEYLLYDKLVKEKQDLVDLGSRFIVLAGAATSANRSLYDNDFCYFPGLGRKPQWRTCTFRPRAANNVSKVSVYPEISQPNELIEQDLSDKPFHKGPVLVGQWLHAILDQDHQEFERLVTKYYQWLCDYEQRGSFTDTAYDLLPFNVVINSRSGAYETIDTEWRVKSAITPKFVLFRALLWFAFENKALLREFASSNNIYSIGTFIVRYVAEIDDLSELNELVSLEESIQSEIDNDFRANAVSLALLQTFDDEVSFEEPLVFQAVWANESEHARLEGAKTKLWDRSQVKQKIELELSEYQSSFPILRLDPMSETGALKIHDVSIVDSSKREVWNSADREPFGSSGLLKDGELWLSLNDDPHWTYDLSQFLDNSALYTLMVSIEWLWGAQHSQALTALNNAVSSLNGAVQSQARRLNEYHADLDFKEQRIADLLGHRKDLTDMVKQVELRVVRERQQQSLLNNQITHLEARLHAQHVRNDELHGYLLMRPTTRAKRVARRWFNRLTGKAPIELEAPQDNAVKPVEEQSNPLPTGELIGQNTEDYGLWVSENSMSEVDIERAKAVIDEMPYKPVFSILVPIYNTDPEYLLPMIESVRAQIYPHWQLCLVDDSSPKTYLKRILEHEALQDDRICIQLNDVNQGISVTTNDALAMATGDYIALLDHDDEISIDALYENAKVINEIPEAGLIYSDEDKMDMQGGRLEPYFKPDYSPDLLDTNNYVCHFTVIKKSIADDIGGFREGLDGSQDHDVILRAADKAERVIHIPKILYHWRKIPGSTAVVYDAKSYAWEAGRKAVEDMRRKHEDNVRVDFGSLKGTYRVYRQIIGQPLISIIIPFKDKPELLDSCLTSILNRTSYNHFEVIGVSNNSDDPLTFERMKHFESLDERIRFVEHNVPFNFSSICNFGVSESQGEYVVLLNNDIEIITPDWIERMLEHAQRDSIGAVGCKLLYPDGRIQHAGVVAGMVGAAGHPHKFFPDNHIGYHGRLHMVYNVSAVTGAMMMMSKEKFLEVGGLDEENLAVAYNDIDLCLKLLDKGYFNLFTPHAKATHHESISRGYEDTDEKMQRLLREQKHFLSTWSDFLAKGDPFYNPNLSLKNERFSLKFKD